MAIFYIQIVFAQASLVTFLYSELIKLLPGDYLITYYYSQHCLNDSYLLVLHRITYITIGIIEIIIS